MNHYNDLIHLKFGQAGLGCSYVIALKIHIFSYNQVTPEPNFMKLKIDMYHYKALMHVKFQTGLNIAWVIALESS